MLSEEEGLQECGVCSAKQASYRCPRCSVRYCSVACYGQHGGGACREQLWQRTLRETLHNERCDEQQGTTLLQRAADRLPEAVDWAAEEQQQHTQQQLLTALATLTLQQQQQQGNDNNDNNDVDLHAQQGNDNNNNDVDVDLHAQLAALGVSPQQLQRVSPQLLKQFWHSRAEWGALLQPWQPWWQHAPLLDTHTANAAAVDRTRIAPFASLTGPALLDEPLFAIVTADVIFDLVYVARLLNGDHLDASSAAWTVFWDLSLVLADSGRPCFESVADWTVRAALRAAESTAGARDKENVNLAFVDTCKVLEHELHIVRALSEAVQIFQIGEKTAKKGEKKKCFLAKKKVEFYLSWANENGAKVTALSRLIEDARSQSAV